MSFGVRRAIRFYVLTSKYVRTGYLLRVSTWCNVRVHQAHCCLHKQTNTQDIVCSNLTNHGTSGDPLEQGDFETSNINYSEKSTHSTQQYPSFCFSVRGGCGSWTSCETNFIFAHLTHLSFFFFFSKYIGNTAAAVCVFSSNMILHRPAWMDARGYGWHKGNHKP